MGAISLLNSFNTIRGIESWPEALWGFNQLSRTRGVEISIWGIEGKELGPSSGMDPMGSLVNTMLN